MICLGAAPNPNGSTMPMQARKSWRSYCAISLGSMARCLAQAGDQLVARLHQGRGKEKELTLVDVGCGYGDLLRAIRRWARKRGLTIRLIGLDLSPETIRIAQTVTNGADEIAIA